MPRKCKKAVAVVVVDDQGQVVALVALASQIKKFARHIEKDDDARGIEPNGGL